MKFGKCAVITLGGLLVSTSLLAGTVKPADSPSYLFVQNAKSASIQAVAQQPGVYQLTLKQPTNTVTYFTPRPARQTGQMSLNTFLDQWQPNKFGQIAPNAGLSAIAAGQSIVIPLVLVQPTYNVKTNTLVYTTTLLDKNQAAAINLKLKHPALLIDHWCYECSAF